MGSRHTEIDVHERIEPRPRDDGHAFARKAWIAAGIFTLLLIVAGLLRAATQVLLIIFAGILLGVFIDGLTRFVERAILTSRGVSRGVSCSYCSRGSSSPSDGTSRPNWPTSWTV